MKSRNQVPASVWRNPLHLVAFGFGSGAAPVAPGTFGTLVGVLLYLLLQHLHWSSYLLIVVVAFFVGIQICGRTAKDIGVHDHPGIVWDEIAGYWVAMLAAPKGWWWVVAGFLLFRLFDIVKPWPISWADKRLEGGFGIMFDDLLAGIYACLCLQLGVYLFLG